MPSSGPLRSRSTHRGQESVAGLLAATTELGTEPAMLVMFRMPLALLGARETRRRARFDHRSDDPDVRGGLPDHDAPRRVADVRAVEGKADHTGHLLDIVFAEAVVGARGTCCGAV